MENAQDGRLIFLLKTCEVRLNLSYSFVCYSIKHNNLLTVKQLYEIGPNGQQHEEMG